MVAVEGLSTKASISSTCHALGIPRANFYRYLEKKNKPATAKKIVSPLALTAEERQDVLAVLNSNRFVDKSPGEIYATLLDEGKYLCSTRTMYRILKSENALVERRHKRRHVQYSKPELLATQPNEVWSWDITKLKGVTKWSYYYLYVILDIYSRYVVGWMIADRESATLAKRFINEVCMKQGIMPNQLTLHADRGSSMKSKLVAQLLADLSITKTHSRPYTSDDNPYSESQFKTLKYCPQFPERFGCLEDAKRFCQQFFKWYNDDHRHSGISMLTPKTVHYGQADKIIAARDSVLAEAFKMHPGRFKNNLPKQQALPNAVWINKPVNNNEENKAAA